MIYAIGGFVQNPLATVDAYNPTTDTWVSKAPLHTTRAWHAAVAAPNGLIYAIGGATFIVGTGPTPLSSVETFNVTTNTWTTSSFPLPVATCGFAAAVDPNGFICVVGGDNPGNATPTTNVYLCNPADPGWITQPAMPGGRATLAAATGPDGLVYAIGGSDGTNPLTTVDALATDKCYPIEQKIAAVQSELSTVQGDLGDLPPNLRVGAEKQIVALGLELKGLEAQLKKCQGG